MERLEIDEISARLLEAIIKVESMGWSKRRELSQTTDDEVMLEALAELNDPSLIKDLLGNPHTPTSVLKKLAKNGDDEGLAVAIARHPKADRELLIFLSKHKSWKVRYSVAASPSSPTEILQSLLKDGHLAVRAMAARRLGLELDEKSEVSIRCSELNQFFERLCQDVASWRQLGDALEKRLETTNYLFGSFYDDCKKALIELKKKLIYCYTRRLRVEHLPNVDLNYVALESCMDDFGELHFDAYIIAAEIEALINQRSALSMAGILAKARGLLPYVKNPYGWNLFEPAHKPEHILEGKRLRLRSSVQVYKGWATVERETADGILALDKLSKVVLAGADPTYVESHISNALYGLKDAKDVFRKIWVGGPMIAIRLFKNGRLDVEYATEEDARKVAEVLVSEPPARSRS